MSASPLSRSLPSWFLIAPFFFWGTAMVAMKGTLAHTTPFLVATVRLLPAGLILLIVTIVLGRSQPQSKTAWAWIIGFALVDGTLFQGFLAQGLSHTSAGLGSVMIDSQPLAVALLAFWLFGERLRLWGWLGLGSGLIGITLLGIPQPWFDQFEQGKLPFSQIMDPAFWDGVADNGQLWMLAAALAMAIGTVMSRWVSQQVDPIVATGWHMILGAIPLGWLSWSQEGFPWQQLTPTDYVALAYTTVFGSALAYGLFFYFAAQGNLTSLSSLTFLTPIFALIFGAGFLGESLTPIQVIGVLITLLSIYLVNQREQLFLGFKEPERFSKLFMFLFIFQRNLNEK